MAKKIVFRLNLPGKTPSSWAIKQDSVMADKVGKGKKFINYYPGSDTVFEEEITNKDLRPKKVPLFTFNPISKQTELKVDENDTALIRYLTTHPWYGTKYIQWSKESEATGKLAQYEKVEKALGLIKESDEIKVQAIAMAVLGLNAFSKTPSQSMADLKQKAIETPEDIIAAMEAPNYENKYLAGLAFASGVIKNNPTNTAVVWEDNGGVILHVATGENGIDKLTTFLTKSDNNSMVLMQELQTRLDDKLSKKAGKDPKDSVIAEKENEIEKLKKQLAEAQQSNAKKQDLKVEPKPNVKEIAVTVDEGTDDSKQDVKAIAISIEKAVEAYKEKYEKEVPLRYKNDLEWIISKLED